MSGDPLFGLKIPSPRVSLALVLACLGFGVFLGSVSQSRPAAKLAASVGPRVKLMLPPPSATETGAGTTPTAPAAPVEQPTPAPAGGGEGAASATAPASGSTHGSGGGAGGKSGSAGGGGEGSGAGAGAGAGAGSGASGSTLPAIKHVFVIMLAEQPYAAVFGPASKAHYLAQTLERRGELLVRYYAVAHDELANGIALLSGQGPTAETAANCPTFAELAPASTGADAQTLGHGCVYPQTTATLAGQLAAKHLTWRTYAEGMSGPDGRAASCAHPALGAADATVGPPAAASGPPLAGQPAAANAPAPGTAYTTIRNPLVYFHSVIDTPACAADDVGLDRLSADLASERRTPSLAYIVPSLCDDGRSAPCAAGQTGGLAAADGFLRKVVPRILASKAYGDGGLIAITVDQAPATGIEADSSSCCEQPRFPALPAPAPLPGGGQLPPSGGGQVGALLLSKFVKAGSVDQDPYNHFSLLRTIEDLFGLRHLGYAGAKGASSFAASVFDAGAKYAASRGGPTRRRRLRALGRNRRAARRRGALGRSITDLENPRARVWFRFKWAKGV